MYLGASSRSPTVNALTRPAPPYTPPCSRRCRKPAPGAGEGPRRVAGQVPSPINPPGGCHSTPAPLTRRLAGKRARRTRSNSRSTARSPRDEPLCRRGPDAGPVKSSGGAGHCAACHFASRRGGGEPLAVAASPIAGGYRRLVSPFAFSYSITSRPIGAAVAAPAFLVISVSPLAPASNILRTTIALCYRYVYENESFGLLTRLCRQRRIVGRRDLKRRKRGNEMTKNSRAATAAPIGLDVIE